MTHVFSKHHFNSPPKSEWTGISKFHTVYFAPSMLVCESVHLVHSGIEDDVHQAQAHRILMHGIHSAGKTYLSFNNITG